jgi:hypothetical protein
MECHVKKPQWSPFQYPVYVRDIGNIVTVLNNVEDIILKARKCSSFLVVILPV